MPGPSILEWCLQTLAKVKRTDFEEAWSKSFNPRSLNPKLVPKTTSINPKMVSKTTNLNPKTVSKNTKYADTGRSVVTLLDSC